ncbi:catalase-like domain-containing protein [Infundibulicybe gibba]|nr:catalase-like domain-containing protein [Infundibulicybe gibba]
MRLTTSIFLLPLSLVSASGQKKRATGPIFDMYQATNVQDANVHKNASQLHFTLSGGNPYSNPYTSLRLGTMGPLLLRGVNLIEQLAYFVRERIPERVVHAVGAGAHGYFEVTTTTGANYSMADVFSEVGKQTPLTVRFSTVGGGGGSADAGRDLRGLSFKIRTSEGIMDWTYLNSPVFWLRDPVKFIYMTHTQKPHPQTHTINYNDYYDYTSANNESTYQYMWAFSDLGTPYGFRHMDAHSGHTYRAVKADGSWHYLKVSLISDQGIKNHTNAEATQISGEDPEFGSRDLFNAIEAGDYPSWTVYFQVMTPAQAEKFKYNVFDLTKEWLPADVPLQEVGKIVLNQNPTNYFQEIEQIAFDPSHMPPGLEPSEDPVLQSRIFAYPDAARYRLGVNHKQLPVNCPLNPVANFLRDGAMSFNNQGYRPNFVSTQDPIQLIPRPYNDDNHTIWTGGAVQYVSTPSEIDFDLPRIFWRNLSPSDQDNMVSNIVGHFGKVTDMTIKKRQLQVFAHVNATFGQRIAAGVNMTLP